MYALIILYMIEQLNIIKLYFFKGYKIRQVMQISQNLPIVRYFFIYQI